MNLRPLPLALGLTSLLLACTEPSPSTTPDPPPADMPSGEDMPGDMSPEDMRPDLAEEMTPDMPQEMTPDMAPDLEPDMPEDMGPPPPPTLDEVLPVVSFTYPLTDAVVPATQVRANGRAAGPTITLYGRGAQDNRLQSVSVNGEAVDSDDGFLTWSVTLDINPGQNTFTLEATDDAGQPVSDLPEIDVFQRGWLSYGARSVAFDASGERVVLFQDDGDGARLERLRVGDNQLDVVSTNGANDPLALSRVSHMTVAGDQVYVGASTRLIRVSLQDGSKTEFRVNGTGRTLRNLAYLEPDVPRDRMFMINNDAEILVVDLTTNMGRVVSSNTVGSGPQLRAGQALTGLAYDAANDRLFVSRVTDVLAVDVASGARSVVSSGDVGAGSAGIPRFITYDPVGDTIYGSKQGEIVAIEPASGDRSVFYELPPRSEEPRHMSVADGRLLIYESRFAYVLGVDIATGAGTWLAGASFPADGTLGRVALSAAHDAFGQRLVFTEQRGVLMELGLETHTRSVLVDREPRDYAHQTPRVLVDQDFAYLARQSPEPAILRYDFAKGEQTVLSDANVPNMDAPFDGLSLMAWGPGRRTLLVVSRQRLLGVDVETGAREVWAELPQDEQDPVHLDFVRHLQYDAINQRALLYGPSEGEWRIIAVDSLTKTPTSIALEASQREQLDEARAISANADGSKGYVLFAENASDAPLPTLIEIDHASGQARSMTLDARLSSTDEGSLGFTEFGDVLVFDSGAHAVFQVHAASGKAALLLQ